VRLPIHITLLEKNKQEKNPAALVRIINFTYTKTHTNTPKNNISYHHEGKGYVHCLERNNPKNSTKFSH